MAKSKVHWLSRELVQSPYHYALFLTEEAYHAELKRLAIPPRLWGEFVTKDAAVNFLQGDSGTLLALVTMRVRKGFSREQIYGLLVHEAVHIWQEVKIAMGESNPGIETEAYSIQRIAQSLMESYHDQTSRKAK